MEQGTSQPSSSSRPRIELLREGPHEDAGSHRLPHVLLAVDQFPRSLGGGERIVLRLADLLPRYGFRVSILTLGVDSQSAVLRGAAPCPIYVFPVQKTWGASALNLGLEIRGFLRQHQFRIVQTFFESSDLWVGPIVKLTSDAKLIWSRRDMGILRGSKHRVAYRWMARVPDRVFAVSEQVRRHAIEVDGIPEERVETVYNGLDLADWLTMAEHKERSDQPRIVVVGNIRRVKGHDLFIRAAAMIAQQFPEARFSIAGEVLEPDFYMELQTLVQQLGLAERFTFAGGVTDLCAFLRDADMFVLPSRSEGFSNAIIEAMAAGLPVVATDVGGNREAVADNVTGRIVPPEDAAALASAMRDILARPEAARAMGTAGRLRVAERFTTDAMMGQISAAYHRLLGSQ